MARTGKSPETFGGWALPDAGRMGRKPSCWTGTGLPLGVMETFGTRQKRWLHNIADVLLFPLKWFILLCPLDLKKGGQASHKFFSAEKHYRSSMGVLGITFRRENPSGEGREGRKGVTQL